MFYQALCEHLTVATFVVNLDLTHSCEKCFPFSAIPFETETQRREIYATKGLLIVTDSYILISFKIHGVIFLHGYFMFPLGK